MGLREVQLAALLHDIGKFAWRSECCISESRKTRIETKVDVPET